MVEKGCRGICSDKGPCGEGCFLVIYFLFLIFINIFLWLIVPSLWRRTVGGVWDE